MIVFLFVVLISSCTSNTDNGIQDEKITSQIAPYLGSWKMDFMGSGNVELSNYFAFNNVTRENLKEQ